MMRKQVLDIIEGKTGIEISEMLQEVTNLLNTIQHIMSRNVNLGVKLLGFMSVVTSALGFYCLNNKIKESNLAYNKVKTTLVNPDMTCENDTHGCERDFINKAAILCENLCKEYLSKYNEIPGVIVVSTLFLIAPFVIACVAPKLSKYLQDRFELRSFEQVSLKLQSKINQIYGLMNTSPVSSNKISDIIKDLEEMKLTLEEKDQEIVRPPKLSNFGLFSEHKLTVGTQQSDSTTASQVKKDLEEPLLPSTKPRRQSRCPHFCVVM